MVKSFARIHETNLKKQGMLAITFANEADYDKFQENDSIDFSDLVSFAPDKQLTLVLNHKDGSKDTVKVNHTYNAGQIGWFKAGSALNLMAKQIAANKAAAKPVAKMEAPKKVTKKVVKAAAKKSTKKVAKKAVKKANKKVAKKTVKKSAKKVTKATKKSVKKATKKVAKKSAKRRR